MRDIRIWIGVAGLAFAPAAARAEEAPAAVEKPATGSLRGTVTLDGASEARRFKFQEVVLSLSGEGLAQASSPPPAEPAVIDQKDIAYAPHVLPVQAGTAIEFLNSDATLHNVHGHCRKNDGFNLAMTPAQKLRVLFQKPEVVTLTCNVHAEMTAFVVVLDNAFFAQPAKDGAFAIAGIPPGTHSLRAWQESLAPVVREVVIKAGEETAVAIDFDSRKKADRKPDAAGR